MRPRIKLELTKETAESLRRAVGQIAQTTPNRFGIKAEVSLVPSDFEELQAFIGYLKYVIEVQTETR